MALFRAAVTLHSVSALIVSHTNTRVLTEHNDTFKSSQLCLRSARGWKQDTLFRRDCCWYNEMKLIVKLDIWRLLCLLDCLYDKRKAPLFFCAVEFKLPWEFYFSIFLTFFSLFVFCHSLTFKWTQQYRNSLFVFLPNFTEKFNWIWEEKWLD